MAGENPATPHSLLLSPRLEQLRPPMSAPLVGTQNAKIWMLRTMIGIEPIAVHIGGYFVALVRGTITRRDPDCRRVDRRGPAHADSCRARRSPTLPVFTWSSEWQDRPPGAGRGRLRPLGFKRPWAARQGCGHSG